MLSRNIAQRGIFQGAVVGAATEAVPEAFQGAQEQLARNLAQIREEQIEVKTRETLDELLTFVHFPNGKMGGQEGSHDDCVVSLAIAAQMCKLHPKVHIAPQRYSFDNPSVNYFHNLSA